MSQQLPFSSPSLTNLKTWFWVSNIALDCLIADQILKYLATNSFKTPFYLTSFFSLRYEQNFGIAWSIPIPYALLLTLNIVLLIAIPIILARKLDFNHKVNFLLMGALIGGALGNIVDRIFRGYVVDFVSIGTFPVFNLADCLITGSIFIILVFYDRITRKP